MYLHHLTIFPPYDRKLPKHPLSSSILHGLDKVGAETVKDEILSRKGKAVRMS